jgi:hypothetical protein
MLPLQFVKAPLNCRFSGSWAFKNFRFFFLGCAGRFLARFARRLAENASYTGRRMHSFIIIYYSLRVQQAYMRAKTKKAGATADAAARGGLPAGAGWLWKREACGEGWEKLWAKATSKRIVLFNDEQVRQKRDSEREGRSPGPGPLSARCTSALSIGGARGGTPRAAPRPLAFPPWRTCVITSSPFFVWLALPRRRRGPWTCWSCSTPPCRRSPSAASSPAACAATRAASRCARAARTPPPAAAAPARPAPRAPRGAWPTCRAAPPTCKPCATSSWSWRQRGPRSTRPGCVSGRCSRRPWFRCLLCVLRQLVVALVGARLVA